MTVLPWQSDYRSRVLDLFDKSIVDIETAFQVNDPRGDKAGVKICAVKMHWSLFTDRKPTSVSKRERNCEEQIQDFKY